MSLIKLYRVIFLYLGLFLSFYSWSQNGTWSKAGAVTHPAKIKLYNVLHTTPSLKNDGKSDNSLLLQKLINDQNKYPSPAIFFFPEGKYLFKQPVYLKSGRILRGVSPEKTQFISNTRSNAFVVFKSQGNLKQVKLKAKLDSDLDCLVLKTKYPFKDADFIEFYQTNDSTIVQKKWIRNWAENVFGMINRIKKKKGDSIWLQYKIPVSFGTDSVFVSPYLSISSVGFENFSIQSINPEMKGHNFLFINAVNSWIDNIESAYTGRYHVSLQKSFKISIKNSYFHHAHRYDGGGHAYGVECGYHTTMSLIENNVFDSLRHALLVHLGANGNVFAYNYSVHPVWNEKGIPPDVSVHGHYPYNNLFEGNEVKKIACTDYWGAAGPKNTFYRNRINGKGIFIHEADETVVVGNECVNPDAVIRVWESEVPFVKHNRIGAEIIDPIHPPLPSSLYLKQKPDFFGKETWPPFGYIDTKNQLPAKKRYLDIIHKKRKNIFVKIWHWIKNIF